MVIVPRGFSLLFLCILSFLLSAMEELQLQVVDESIHIAAIQGDEQKVKELIKKGMEVNSRDGNGCVPLHGAALNGHLTIIEILINNGADLNVRAQNGATPLYTAVSAGHACAVLTLIQHGANIRAKCLDYMQPLLYVAAENGHEEVVKILLEKGAEVDCPYKGSTPLQRAAVNAQWGVLKLLISMGADRNRRIDQDKKHYEIIKDGLCYVNDVTYAMALEKKTAYELALANKNDGHYFMVLGDLYYAGQNNIAANFATARYNYERAAAQNNNPQIKVEALVKLGEMYRKGYGVKIDYEKAQALFSQAACLQGELDASKQLDFEEK